MGKELHNYEIEVEDNYGEEEEKKGDGEDVPMIKSLLRYYADIFLRHQKGYLPREQSIIPS